MSLPVMSFGDRFCVSRKGGTGGGGCTRRVQTAWPCLGSAVERFWSALDLEKAVLPCGASISSIHGPFSAKAG